MIKGYQFDREKITADADASLYAYLNNDKNVIITGRGNSMKVSFGGLKAIVDTGEAVIMGRFVEVTEPEIVEIPVNYNGYLVIEIDLSKTNESSGEPGSENYTVINNQLSIKCVERLVQDNLNDGGLLYHFNLGEISSTNTEISFNEDKKATQKDIVYKAKPIKEIGTSYTTYEVLDDRLPNNENELYEGMQIDVHFVKKDAGAYFHPDLPSSIKINNMRSTPIIAGKGILAFEDIEEGSIQTLKYYNGQWFLMSPPATKWEPFIHKIEMAPLTNLASVQVTSAVYRSGFVSLVFRCYVSKALTAGTVMKARVHIAGFEIASLCSGGGYLGRTVIVGTLGTSGEFNINFTGADFGATANFLFVINIPVNTKNDAVIVL